VASRRQGGERTAQEMEREVTLAVGERGINGKIADAMVKLAALRLQGD
jgi:hypothetical protein